MPTAPRLVAAILLAAMGAVAAYYFEPLVHEDTILPYFIYLSAGLGAVCGWWSVGRRVEYGHYGAISAGFTGAALFTFWFIFFQVAYRVIQFALWQRYRQNSDAIDGFVDWMIEYTLLLLTPEMLGVLLVGGILSGLGAVFAARSWS